MMKSATAGGPRTTTRSLLLLFVALAAACNCGEDPLGQATTGVTLVDPPGKVDEFERTIDFAGVRVASLNRRTLLFRNDGARTATITSATLTSDSQDFFLAGATPLPRLEAKQEWELELRYRPGEIGADSATVVVETDSEDTPRYTIHVVGRGAASEIDVCTTNDAGAEVCLDAQPDGRLTIAVGEAAPGAEKRRPLIVKNKGDASLTVSRIAPTDNTTAEITIAPGNGPADVLPGTQGAFEIVYAPQDGGTDEGAIEILSDDPDEPRLLVYLVAEGLAPRLCVDPFFVEFGDQALGTTAHKTLKLHSCGREAVTLKNLVLFAGDRAVFAIANPPPANHVLQPGASYELDLTYKPASFEDDTGKVTIFSDVPGSERGFVNLHGRGVGCTISLVPASVGFGNVSVGGRTSRTVQIRNLGTGDCTISEFRAPAAPFALDRVPVVPLVLPAGQTDSLVVSYAPTANASATGSVVLVTNEQRGDIAIPLSGKGIAPLPCDLQAQPTSLLYTGISTGQAAVQNVLLKNFGTDECTISEGKMLAGSSPAFSVIVSGFPPPTVAPGGSLSVPVTFKPTTSGVHNGTLRISFSDGNSLPFPIPGGNSQKLDIALEGGTLAPAICLNPEVLDYGAVTAGVQKELSFTITSCGAGALGVRGLGLRPGTSSEFTLVSPPRLPAFLQPNQSLTVRVLYKPQTGGADVGFVEVLNNDPARPAAKVKLKANAEGVCEGRLSCAFEKLKFPTMEIGRAASMSVVCTNTGSQDITVTAATLSAATSADFKVTVGPTPQTVKPGESTRLSVTYLPQDAGTDTGAALLQSTSCEAVRVELEAAGKLPNYPRCPPEQLFQPVEKWAWSGGATQADSNNVAMSPVVVNVSDDNADGRIDQDDVPDVLFTSCRARECCVNCLGEPKVMDLSGKGMLRAVHGRNGTELWSVTDAGLMLTAVTQIAAGDLDGDNLVEIIAVKHHFQPGGGQFGMDGKYKSGTLLVFDHTGRLKFETEQWTGETSTVEQSGAPTLGDIDGDGLIEILFERTVFNSNGTRRVDMAESGNDGHGLMSTMIDLNGDGKPEVVSGRHAFKADGSVFWSASGSGVQNGPTMVLDTDADGLPEVVLRDMPGSVRIIDALTGQTKSGPHTWTMPPEGGVCSSAMAAADLDGDGKPEIIIPSGDYIYAFRGNGQKLWQMPISDYGGQCGASGAAAFDFEGDGKYEVVYHDTQHMYVYRGTTGQLIYDAPRNSSTIWETPVIADVDNDGHADLVMTNENGILGIGSGQGVKVLSNVGNNWPATRRIWNQHTYHVSDVYENGSIPRVETPSWKSTNSWRAQHSLCRPQ